MLQETVVGSCNGSSGGYNIGSYNGNSSYNGGSVYNCGSVYNGGSVYNVGSYTMVECSALYKQLR